MKPTGKELEFLRLLRELDTQQREQLLADTQRAVEAARIVARIGKIRRVKPVQDHKIVRAFGGVPRWKFRKPGEST